MSDNILKFNRFMVMYNFISISRNIYQNLHIYSWFLEQRGNTFLTKFSKYVEINSLNAILFQQ